LPPIFCSAWRNWLRLPKSANVAANFKQHCSSCHGEDRLGGLGPALLPDNLARLRKPEAEKVIREGRLASQMQGFGHLALGGRSEGAGRVCLHADQADAGLG
jgi:mono/diheme cytochrome c family protein